MGILKRAVDTAYTFRFLRLLTMNWEDTKAYELGIIDQDGRRIKKPSTGQEKSAYTLFHRLVFNLKRILNLVPGSGARKLASYASALYLIREYVNLSDEKLLSAIGFDSESIQESEDETELFENRVYQINKDIVINDTLVDSYAEKGSTITIVKSIGKHFGSTIYEAKHNLSDKTVYISESDIAVDLNQEEMSVTTADIAMPLLPLKTDMGDKYQRFKIPSTVFRKFDRGRKKYQRWKVFLDLEDEQQMQIANFARKHRDALIIIEDEITGAMRAVRPTSSDGW